jgi:hypothetical protein
MKTLIAKILFAISNKHTRGRSEGEFRGVIGQRKGQHSHPNILRNL